MKHSGSLEEDIARILFDRYREISGERVPLQSRFRVVVVVGAGASKAACGLPLGGELAHRVEKAVREAGTSERLIKIELDRLESVNRLGRHEFETRLLALSRFDPETVFSVLCDQCDVRHYPSLTYEIIAHMMKHGFLDAVINFNFDEVLDQSIEDELGSEQYVRIVRDGEWSLSLRSHEHGDSWRFDRPLYVKPHGTVSERESLRFTREAYFALPPDMARLLNTLFGGDPVGSFPRAAAKQNPRHRIPVCLLVLGHALESFEFNKILEGCPKQSRLYSVAFGAEKEPELRTGLHDVVKKMAKGRSLRIRDQPKSLDKLMKSIWEAIEQQAAGPSDKIPVRGIERHELISELFRPTRPGRHFRRIFSGQTDDHRRAIETYFEDRFLVEAALSIAKAKGFVDVRQFYGGRAGRYYQMLTSIREGNGQRPVDHYLNILGMERRDVSTESYWHETAPPVADKFETVGSDIPKGAPIHRLTLDPETFHTKTCTRLVQLCKENLSDNRKDKLGPEGTARLLTTLKSMFDGDEVEIIPARPADFIFRFEQARPIYTVAALKRHSERLLGRNPWKLLLCVAESGEWLIHQNVEKLSASNQAAIGLIVADTVYEERLRQISGMNIMRLPWHLHNRHLTIKLTRGTKGEFSPSQAIYFERRYRSPRIAPVTLSASADLERIMDDFTMYWLKAERYQSGLSETIELTQSQLQMERVRILSELVSSLRTKHGV